MAKQVELAAMRRAVELAAQALGTTSPNPSVGCVILDQTDRQVGEGFTSPPGGPHAEISALRAAGPRAAGGTALVTLEPCNHQGRTPPCTRALIEAGIRRVVFAVPDPHPLAAGGADTLRDAGIEVEAGLLADETRRGMEAWLMYVTRGRPFVTWFFVSSLDGRGLAAADGGGAVVAEVRERLRRESDAVILGEASEGGPTVALLDPQGREETLRLGPSEREAEASPSALTSVLYERGVCSVLLEDAPGLASSFLAASCMDRVVAYIAPALLGPDGRPPLSGAGAQSIDAAWRLQIDEVTRLGGGVQLVARPGT